MTELTAMLLQTHGFHVLTANFARDAIQIVREKQPQAVILDLMMPDMDGRQVCKTIRDFSNVPIIILSALNDPETVASALDSGADDYLVKPVPSDVLAAHLNRLIKRTGKLSMSPEKIANSWIPASASMPTTPIKSLLKSDRRKAVNCFVGRDNISPYCFVTARHYPAQLLFSASATARGDSIIGMWPTPDNSTSRARGTLAWISRARSTGINPSASP